MKNKVLDKLVGSHNVNYLPFKDSYYEFLTLLANLATEYEKTKPHKEIPDGVITTE